MNLIPVIDLLNGEVVHAVAGNRASYRPFRVSQFKCDSAVALVDQWISCFRPKWIYIADLNSIQGNGNNTEIIQQLGGRPVNFLLDCGFRNWQQYLELKERLNEVSWVPVFGTETLESIQSLASDVRMSREECFISIDIRGQKVVGGPELNKDPFGFLEDIQALGFKQVILLDLDVVGTDEAAWDRWNLSGTVSDSTQVFAGGGVKSKVDFDRLEKLGFDGALVASAIHRGEFGGLPSR